MSDSHTRGFGSDNHSGIHPDILQSILEANQGHSPSYGTDSLTREVNSLFKEHFGGAAEPFFVFNGTAANVLCLDALVQPHQSVLCADTSHLWLDECGAPERYVGCKLIPVASTFGKLTPESIAPHLIRGGDQHFSQPGAISITQPTELGTCYTLDELTSLVTFAKSHGLKFHIDGARLTNAAAHLDCTLAAISSDLGIDALSFGGTKNGLFGAEAVLLFDTKATEGFKYRRKQAMQLPSKTRFIAAQYKAYLRADLWKKIASHGNEKALELRASIAIFDEIGLPYPTQSNAVFATIPKTWVKPLKKSSFFYVWETDPCLIRLMTTYDTTSAEISAFGQCISAQKSGH